MKIYAYRVSSSGNSKLRDVVEKLNKMPLASRSVGVGVPLRLEAMQFSKTKLFTDFAKSRSGHGPGKISKNIEISELPLESDEAFGEDTAILFDLDTNYLAAQFNFHGPKAARIAEYLSIAEVNLDLVAEEKEHGFAFGAVLLEDAYARLKKTGLLKTLEFDVALPGTTKSDMHMGQSLSRVLDAPFPEGSSRVTITIHAEGKRDSGLERKGVLDLVKDILNVRNFARKLRVNGKDGDSGRRIPIDFLEETIMSEFKLKLGAGGRYSRKDRWAALESAMQQWKIDGLLK